MLQVQYDQVITVLLKLVKHIYCSVYSSTILADSHVTTLLRKLDFLECYFYVTIYFTKHRFVLLKLISLFRMTFLDEM